MVVHVNLLHVASQLLWRLQSAYAMAVVLPSLPRFQGELYSHPWQQGQTTYVLKNNNERRQEMKDEHKAVTEKCE